MALTLDRAWVGAARFAGRCVALAASDGAVCRGALRCRGGSAGLRTPGEDAGSECDEYLACDATCFQQPVSLCNAIQRDDCADQRVEAAQRELAGGSER